MYLAKYVFLDREEKWGYSKIVKSTLGVQGLKWLRTTALKSHTDTQNRATRVYVIIIVLFSIMGRAIFYHPSWNSKTVLTQQISLYKCKLFQGTKSEFPDRESNPGRGGESAES